MRRVLIVPALLLIPALCSAQQATCTLAVRCIMGFNPPTTGPSYCPDPVSHAHANYMCDVLLYIAPEVTGWLFQTNWTDVDTGTTAPNYVWTSHDAKFALYNGSIATSTCTNTGNVSTCNYAGGLFAIGMTVCVAGENVSAYNGCHVLTGPASSNGATTITWAQTSPVASATTGSLSLGCGGALPGRVAAPCMLEDVVRHFGNPTITPVYLALQSYANSACTSNPWGSKTIYALHVCVTNGGHFYHELSTTATGPCISGTVFSAGSDGTCTWNDDGTTNAFLQEAMVGSQIAGDGTAPPNTRWLNYPGGQAVIYNSASTICAGGATLCTTGDVVSGFPLCWDTPCATAYNAFNVALIQHTAGLPYANQFPYIRIGGSWQGQWFGFFEKAFTGANFFNWTYAQYKGTWVNYFANSTYATYKAAAVAANAGFLLNGTSDNYNGCGVDSNCFDYPLTFAAAYAANGWSTGSNGVSVADLAAYAAGTAADSNWVNVHNVYHDRVPLIEGQQVAGSCPFNSQGNCTTTEKTTGSLAQWLPFEAQHYTTSYEIYLVPDAICTWDPNSTAAGNYLNYADCQTDSYQTYWNEMSQGLPNFTSSVSGTGSIGGTGTLQ